MGETCGRIRFMGEKIIKNLSIENIRRDFGKASINEIQRIETIKNIVLPTLYKDFISIHNEASLHRDVFDYNDPNRGGSQNSDGISFENVEEILENIDLLQYGEESDWDIKYRFEDGLIPFGENGGGDMICFDYRKNKDTDNPPIVIWNHDMGLENRVVFIADNFEEFVNILHEPED